MDEEEKKQKTEREQEVYDAKLQKDSPEQQPGLKPAFETAVLSSIVSMNSILSAMHNTQMLSSSLSAAIQPISDAQKAWSINALPLIVPSLQNYCQGIAKNIIDNYVPMSEAMRGLASSLQGVLSNYSVQWPKITSPILEVFKNISFTPIQGLLESLKDFNLSLYRTRLYHLLLCETFDAKWIPNAIWDAAPELLTEVLSIIRSTKKSKNRVKRIDKAVLKHYTKQRVESIKKTWRNKGLPEFSMRMLHQAVQAYHRKEYAITIVMLSTMWEGIIYDKANDFRGKNGNRTKSNFEKLIKQNDFDELFQSFFDEYIMYDCRSVEQVIEDVPGRNSSAHSWYNKYPSRKAALNAILFTNFLLNLEPIIDETEDVEYADV